MPTWAVILIVVVIAAVAILAWYYLQRRSHMLRSRFGPEYQRAVEEHGSRFKAETELEKRARRVERFHIRSLPPSDRERFIEDWRADQAHFVDEPHAAVLEADRLVTELMRARGYPISDFDRRAEDLSVDHPSVVQNYRSACEIAQKAKRNTADTEDLRKAMVYYRALFDDLLETHEVRR